MGKVYLVETYQEFDEWCRANNTSSGDKNVIVTMLPYAVERLKGLEIKPEDLKVIGDPMMPYSVWINLQTRMRK